MAEPKKWIPTEGKKAATAKNWSPEGTPTSTSEVKYEESVEACELTSTKITCLSLDALLYKGTLSGTTSTNGLVVGGTTEAPSKIALRFGASCTLTWGKTSIIKLQSTSSSSGNGEEILAGGKVLPGIEMTTTGGTIANNKWVLGENLSAREFLQTKGSLNLNNHNLTLANVEGTGGILECTTASASLTLGTGTVTFDGITWNVETTSPTFSGASATVEALYTGQTKVSFGGGSKPYGTIVVKPKRLALNGVTTIKTLSISNAQKPLALTGTSVEGNTKVTGLTFASGEVQVGDEPIWTGVFARGAVVTAVTPGAGTGEFTVSEAAKASHSATAFEVLPFGCQLSSVSTTVETALTSNGKAGEPSRLCAQTAGESKKLVIPAGNTELTATMVVKDIKVETGVLYLPNGIDGGNNTNIKFEAIPSTSPNALAMLV